MPLKDDIAAILADADELTGSLATAGIPRHCAEAWRSIRDRIAALADSIADPPKPKARPETKAD